MEAAAKTEMSPVRWWCIEAGRYDFDIETLAKLCVALEVDVMDLFEMSRPSRRQEHAGARCPLRLSRRVCQRARRPMRRHRVVSEHEQREWFARNVRSLRHTLGLSMREAGARVGMSTRQWQKIEGNETNATIATLAKVCSALGADIVELMSVPRRSGAH